MREIARAQAPQVVPFGFHGSFVPTSTGDSHNR